MGNRSSKSRKKTPSFQPEGKTERHSCVEQGCFNKKELRSSDKRVKRDLKKAIWSRNWMFTDEHEMSLRDSLLHWKCEMIMKDIIEMVKQPVMIEETGSALIRKDMFFPYLKVCHERLTHKQSRMNIIVTGPLFCGKSCLVHSWLHSGQWKRDQDPSIEDMFTKKLDLPNECQIEMTLIDMIGSDEFKTIRIERIKETDILIICAKIDTVDTMKEHFDRFIEEYYDSLQTLDKEDDQAAAVILVGTQLDENPMGAKERIESMLGYYDYLPYLECSAKEGINLDWILVSAVYECWLKEMYVP